MGIQPVMGLLETSTIWDDTRHCDNTTHDPMFVNDVRYYQKYAGLVTKVIWESQLPTGNNNKGSIAWPLRSSSKQDIKQ